MNLFDRLKEERERLGFTQPHLAAITEVGKTTVINWEKGASSPSALQLASFAASGADVLYVITGQRSQGAAEVELLPADERVLVDAYRRCNPDAKRNLIQTAALLSAGVVDRPNKQRRSADSGGVSQTANSNRAVQIHGSKNRVTTKGN
jgi:transcriptional regulator with XRE-family HTH domain